VETALLALNKNEIMEIRKKLFISIEIQMIRREQMSSIDTLLKVVLMWFKTQTGE
jgi:hypothetical protein